MTSDALAARDRHQDLTLGYTPAAGIHDEMMDISGAIRPHWAGVISAMAAFDPAECGRRAQLLNRRVRETGIAHDVFADPSKTTQPWRVDLAPLLIAAAEWRWLEQALIQRARLFDAILADLYGAQELMATGLIPPALVHCDPAFLRACWGIKPGHGHLQFCATDLARDADGRWRVIDSHAETPAGIGLVLANRLVHTHVAGELFAATNAQRLAPFFREVQGALASRSNRADPRIALLTPGPRHEDYFSHAYLARYLGFILVEGNDLRVVGEQVMIKTLEGLQPIDLIVRCVEGSRADPLELDPTGFLGPAGLAQVCRARPDLVVNSLGSALVENRGLGPLLPRICERLLGQAIMLEDAPRNWLGDPAANAQAVRNLDHVVIRPAHEGTARPGRGTLGRAARLLNDRQRQSLIADINLNGDRLVAEEHIGFGTSPVWTPAGLRPSPFAVRLYAAATQDGYRVMPGGLAMTINPETAVGLSAPEGETRDVWVLSEASEPVHVSLWRPTFETAHVQRSQRVLQSRVADDLFWLGRYAERADWTLRVLRSALVRQQEDSSHAPSLRAATICLQTLLAKDPKAALVSAKQARAGNIEQLARFLMSESGGSYGLHQTCDSLHRIAALTRDRLSHEAWRTLNMLGPNSGWRERLQAAPAGESVDLLDAGLLAVAGFNGLMHENMTRNSGWSFLDMGRRLERGLNLCEAITPLFGVAADVDDEMHGLIFLLEAADSFITYRSRYRLDPMLALVLDLLLIDESNPRSLAFQLASISAHLETLPQAKHGENLPEERRIILSLLSSMRLADVQQIAKTNDRGQRLQLSAVLSDKLAQLPQLSDAIMRRYFNVKDEAPYRLHSQA